MVISNSKPDMNLYRLIKYIGELPFVRNTFISKLHTMEFAQPLFPSPSLLNHVLIGSVPIEFNGLSPFLVNEEATEVLTIVPITDGELQYSKDHGMEAFCKFSADRQFGMALDVNRPCLFSNADGTCEKRSHHEVFRREG